MNLRSAARRIALSICSFLTSGNQQRWTHLNGSIGASDMENVGRMRPSVLKVPRFAIASWRIEYAAHLTPASDLAAILTPDASAAMA